MRCQLIEGKMADRTDAVEPRSNEKKQKQTMDYEVDQEYKKEPIMNDEMVLSLVEFRKKILWQIH